MMKYFLSLGSNIDAEINLDFAQNIDNQEILLTTIQDAINHYSYMIWAEVYNESIELIQKVNTPF